MNLSNMKKMNNKPLRRAQGFKGDGVSYIENNSLNVNNDFTVVYRVILPSTDLNYISAILKDTSGLGTSYFILRALSDGNINLKAGFNLTSGNDFQNLLIPYQTETELIIVACSRDDKIILSVNGLIETSEGEYTYKEVLPNEILPAGFYLDSQGSVSISTPITDTLVMEILQLNEALTDAQLLEFANLARFTDHSDYATFNKNAYYPLDYNTKDYSGNGNNGTVTGTEQYEIVERGIKSINGAEVLSKRGFVCDGTRYLSNTPIDYLQDFVIVVRMQISDIVTEQYPWGFYNNDTSNVQQYFMFCRIQSDGNIRIIMGSNTAPAGFEDVIVPYSTGEVVLIFGRRNNYVIGSVNNSGIVESDAQFSDVILVQPCNPLVFARCSYDTASGVYDPIIMEGTTPLEYLEIQDALTDAQLLEFANLARFTDHSDYATFNKNAYYNLNSETTKDYTNGTNNGTVIGTEQYETIQNGLTDWKDPVLP